MANIAPKTLLVALEAAIAAADAKAVVVPYELPGLTEGQNIAMARSPRDNARAHCWQIWFDREDRQRKGDTVDAVIVNTAGKKRRYDVTYWFTVRLMLEYKDIEAASSTMLEAQDLWTAVADYLSERPRLGIALENVRFHNELQRATMRQEKFGECTCVLGAGFLGVLCYRYATSVASGG